MRVKNTLIKVIALTVSLNAFYLKAEDTVDAKKLVSEANKAFYYAGDDSQQKARMIIVDKNGSKQLRQFNIFKKDKEDGGDQDFLVVFEKPSDVKNTVFLVNKHLESEDDRWIYLPGLDLDKRISAADKRTSFVGSNFFYEDISGRNIDLDDFELVSETEQTYEIKATPKNSDLVEFDYYIITIDKTNMLPIIIDYFSNGKLYRKGEILDIKSIEGIPTVLKARISDLNAGSYTLVQFRQPIYNAGLKDNLFTERSLRNPPKKLFKK